MTTNIALLVIGVVTVRSPSTKVFFISQPIVIKLLTEDNILHNRTVSDFPVKY